MQRLSPTHRRHHLLVLSIIFLSTLSLAACLTLHHSAYTGTEARANSPELSVIYTSNQPWNGTVCGSIEKCGASIACACPSIQRGIDAVPIANDPNIVYQVLVLPDRYFGRDNLNIDFQGKALWLYGPGATLDCTDKGDLDPLVPIMRFDSGESRSTIVDGFAFFMCLQGLNSTVLINGSSPTIQNVWMDGKSDRAFQVENGSPLLSNVNITGSFTRAVITAASSTVELVDSMFSGIQSILVIESTDSNLSILNTQFANNTLHMTCISALLANDLQQCRVPDRINTYIDDMPAEQDDRTAAAPPPPAAAAAAANVGDDSDTVWYSVTITNSSFVDCGGQSVESVCVGYQFVVTIVNSNFTHSLVRERGTISTPAAEVLLFSNNVTITNTMFHGFSTVFENLASVYAKPAALVCLPPSSNRVEERPRAVPNDQASALSHMVAAPGMQVAQRPTPGNAVLSRVTFLHNHAAFGIGALRIDGYRATLTDCLFVGNSGMWGTASFYLPNRYTNASASNDAPQVDILLDHTRFLNNSGLIVSPVNIYRAQRVKISHSYFASNVARINEIFAKSGSGGALEMLLPAGFATIEHSIFTNNSAENYGGSILVQSGGGTTCTDPGMLSLLNDTFTQGTAMIGGHLVTICVNATIQECAFATGSGRLSAGCALLTKGDISIRNSNFTSCKSRNSGGGAVISTAGQVSIDGSHFTDNSANNGGGGLVIENVARTPSSVTSCTFANNTATNGGGIVVGGQSVLSFEHCHFANNRARYSAGHLFMSITSSSTFRMCDFYGGSSDLSGGAIVMRDASEASFRDCSIVNNTSRDPGGALFLGDASRSSFHSTIISHNRAGTSGGGLKITNSAKPSFFNCTINFNRCDSSGGGASIDLEAAPVFQNTTFAFNEAHSYGAAAFLGDKSNSTFVDVSIRNNSSPNDAAGFYVTDRAIVTFNDTEFSHNYALASGAAILSQVTTLVRLNRCSFRHNQAESAGGAIMTKNNATIHAIDCEFLNNNASTGGALFTTDSCQVLFTNSTFRSNVASSRGGAVWGTEICAAVFVDCTFDSNAASNPEAGDGGAIANEDSVFYTLTNCTFLNNTASSGGGMYISSSLATTLINCRFIGNSANISGGGINTDHSSWVLLINSYFENNCARQGGGMLLARVSEVWSMLTRFVGNSAASYGGAIGLTEQGILRALALTITNNTVLTNGGGLYAGPNSGLFLNASLISNNYAIKGGGCHLLTQRAHLYAVRLVGNQATVAGGGLAMITASSDAFPLLHSELIFRNLSIVNNSIIKTKRAQTVGGGGIYIESTASSTPPPGSSGQEQQHFSLDGDDSSSRSKSSSSSSSLFQQDDSDWWYHHGKELDDHDPMSPAPPSPPPPPTSMIDMYQYCTVASRTPSAAAAAELARAKHRRGIRPPASAFLQYMRQWRHLAQEESVGDEPPSNPPWWLEYTPFWHDNSTDYTNSFSQMLIQGNTASNGGGIYFSFSSPNFTFANGVEIRANHAHNYGGGIYISKQLVPNLPWMFGAQFIGNTASRGGGSVAWATSALPNEDAAGSVGEVLPPNSLETAALAFCSQCAFKHNEAPYQSPNGTATLPVKVAFESGCPTQFIDSPPYNVSVALFDAFSTQVRGPILRQYPTNVTLSHPDSCRLSMLDPSQMSQNLSAITGTAVFESIFFQTPSNNASCVLQVTASSPPFSLLPLQCNLTLTACIKGQPHSKNGMQECASRLVNSKVAVALFGIVLLLLLVLLVIAMWGGLVLYRRYRMQQQWRAIPEFQGKPNVSLRDILNDPGIRVIPWRELEILERIGAGASGTVNSGRWRSEMLNVTRDVAIKQLIYGTEVYEDKIREFLVEIKLMSSLTHENVVEFLGIAHNPETEQLFLVTELVTRGNLRSVLDKTGDYLTWEMRLKLLRDVAKGMAYLHKRAIIHRDLKPQNVLVTNDWVAKIVDFGVSTIKPSVTQTMTVIGTPKYMAPEVLSNNKYGEMSDVFSFGVLMCEVYSGVVPYSEFSNLNAAQLLFRIVNERLRPSTAHFPRSLAQLIDDCVNEEPKLRPTFDELVVRLPRLANITLLNASAGAVVATSFVSSSAPVFSPMSLPAFKRRHSSSSGSDYDGISIDDGDADDDEMQITTASLIVDDDDDGPDYIDSANSTAHLHSINALSTLVDGTTPPS